MNVAKQENATIMITDINGTPIKQEQVIATAGSSIILLDISGFVPSTYLLKPVCKSKL